MTCFSGCTHKVYDGKPLTISPGKCPACESGIRNRIQRPQKATRFLYPILLRGNSQKVQ